MSPEDSSPQAAPGHMLAGVGTGGNNGTLEGVFTAPVAQSATLQGLRTRKKQGVVAYVFNPSTPESGRSL